MKKQITKVQKGRGILKTTIPKTIIDMAELEKGDTLEWEMMGDSIIVRKKSVLP